MGNLQSTTDLTQLMQDVQYTAALQGMTPQEKSAYFQSQRTEFLDNVLNNRSDSFQKTLTDATRNSAIQNSLMFYQQRNRDLKDMGQAFDGQNTTAINTATYNNNLAQRQYEMNEWSYNNKLDTLFVFQILFITILISAGLVYLQRAGFYSAGFLGLMTGILLFIDVLIIANRAIYTNRTRDQRFWNKKKFAGYTLPSAAKKPTTCVPPTAGASAL